MANAVDGQKLQWRFSHTNALAILRAIPQMGAVRRGRFALERAIARGRGWTRKFVRARPGRPLPPSRASCAACGGAIEQVEAGSALCNGVIRIISWLLAKGCIRALRRREGAFEGNLDA